MKQTFKALLFTKAFLLSILILFNNDTYAQDNKDTKSKIEGMWILESCSLLEIREKDSIPLDTKPFKNDPFFAIFDELTFRSDMVRIINNDYNYDSEGAFILKDDMIKIPFTGAVFNLKYSVKDGILHLIQNLESNDTPLNKKFQLQTTYKRKSNTL